MLHWGLEDTASASVLLKSEINELDTKISFLSRRKHTAFLLQIPVKNVK